MPQGRNGPHNRNGSHGHGSHGQGARRGGSGIRFDKILRAVGPMVAMAAVGGIMSGRRGGNWNAGNWRNCNFSFDGLTGVPLDELDLTGDVPSEIVLASSDNVVISKSKKFSIKIEGDGPGKEDVRFKLDGDTLTVMRENMGWNGSDDDSEPTTILIKIPAIANVTIAGSGDVTTKSLAKQAEVVIAGSGRLSAPKISCENLEVTIAGSGHFSAGGRTDSLELTIAGSGFADLADLKADVVDVNIAGSGNVTFSSDGTVEANIMGSGNVTVHGNARCTVNSMGSGSLVCERRDDKAA